MDKDLSKIRTNPENFHLPDFKKVSFFPEIPQIVPDFELGCSGFGCGYVTFLKI